MKPLTDHIAYGYQELRRVYIRYMSYSLSIAVSLMVTCIIGYNIQESSKLDRSGNNKNGKDTLKIEWTKWQPPLNPVPLEGFIAAAIPKFKIGIPVPIPGFSIDTADGFATQKQLANYNNQNFNDGNMGTDGAGWGNIIEPYYPSPDSFYAVEFEPRVVLNPRPDYPELLVRTGIEGNVYIKVLVSTDGKVIKSMVLKSDNDLFISPAVEAVKKWTFTPALMNGKPVPVWVSIPFRFRLSKM